MGVLEKSSKKNRNYNVDLQLTAMVDMFTVILVFLLKSYSTEVSNITVNNKNLNLPMSTENRNSENLTNLIITKNEVMVEGQTILRFEDGGDINSKDVGRDGVLLPKLYGVLKDKRNLQEESIDESFKGIIILQADKDLQYKILHKVLYTAGEAGFPKYKLLVLRKNQ